MFVHDYLKSFRISNLTQEQIRILGISKEWKYIELTEELRDKLRKILPKINKRSWKKEIRKLKRKQKALEKKIHQREILKVPKEVLLANKFYETKAWKELRYKVLRSSNGKCSLCGRTAKESNSPLHVDHIIPRSINNRLSLEISNLQVLCADCNIGKGNTDSIDWQKAKL